MPENGLYKMRGSTVCPAMWIPMADFGGKIGWLRLKVGNESHFIINQ